MKTKQIFLGAATVCMLTFATLMLQSMIGNSANATPGDGNGELSKSLLHRVTELELRQNQDDKEFLLIDASLSDLENKVDVASARTNLLRADVRKLRTELNKLGIPVDTLVVDEIGVPLKARSSLVGDEIAIPDRAGKRNGAGYRGTGGSFRANR